MLLRPEDPDILIMATGISRSPSPDLYPQHSPPHQNDDLDDVWGSAPSSPSLPHTDNDRLLSSQQHHPSDIPRLQQEHSTAGYRDGITVAKAESAQKGFDEGFGLGAVIGSKVGLLLGLLEGLAASLPEDTDLRALLDDARRELDVISVFGRDYWDEEGVWKYDVPERDGDDVLFKDVADAHPLIGKWQGIVKGLHERWNVDLGVIGEEEEVGTGMEGKGRVVKREDKGGTTSKEVLEW